MQKRESLTGSAKRLKRKGCTSSRVSGPPRLSNKTPTFSSPISDAMGKSWDVEVTNAFKGNKNLLNGCLEYKDGEVPDQPNESLATAQFLETLKLTQASTWTPETQHILCVVQIALGNNLWQQETKKTHQTINFHIKFYYHTKQNPEFYTTHNSNSH